MGGEVYGFPFLGQGRSARWFRCRVRDGRAACSSAPECVRGSAEPALSWNWASELPSGWTCEKVSGHPARHGPFGSAWGLRILGCTGDGGCRLARQGWPELWGSEPRTTVPLLGDGGPWNGTFWATEKAGGSLRIWGRSGEGLGMGQGTRLEASPGATAGACVIGGTGGEASTQEPRSPGDHGGDVGAVRRRGCRSSESRAARPPAPRARTPGGGQAASAGTCRERRATAPHAACSVGSASRSGHSFQPPRLRERSAQPGGLSRLRVPGQRPPGRGRGHCVVPASALRLLPRDSPHPAPQPPNPPKGHCFRGSSPSISVARSRDSCKRSRTAVARVCPQDAAALRDPRPAASRPSLPTPA